MGKQDTGSAFARRPSGHVLAVIWLLLAASLCALPFVAGSQNMVPGSVRGSNEWLERYNQAMTQYRAGAYAPAYKGFRELADYGSAGAQTMLGHLYWSGKGVAQSYGKAFMWFHRAAERGYAPGQLALGRAYAQGRGIGQDKVQAALWLSLALAHGAPSLQKVARAELVVVNASLSADDRLVVDALKRRWRPDVALMP